MILTLAIAIGFQDTTLIGNAYGELVGPIIFAKTLVYILISDLLQGVSSFEYNCIL